MLGVCRKVEEIVPAPRENGGARDSSRQPQLFLLSYNIIQQQQGRGPGAGWPLWPFRRRCPATLLPSVEEGCTCSTRRTAGNAVCLNAYVRHMTIKMAGVAKMAAGLASSSSTGARINFSWGNLWNGARGHSTAAVRQ